MELPAHTSTTVWCGRSNHKFLFFSVSLFFLQNYFWKWVVLKSCPKSTSVSPFFDQINIESWRVPCGPRNSPPIILYILYIMYQNFLDLFNGELRGPHGTGHKTYKIMGVTLTIVGFFVPCVFDHTTSSR